jgi:hypothetical protein
MYSAFKTDAKKEAEGIFVEFGEFRVLIRRAGGANKLYAKTMEKLVAPHRRMLQLGQLAEGVMKSILAEGYAKAVIIDFQYKVEDVGDGLSEPTMEWKSGIELADGTMGEVTEERVKEILLDVPFIFDTIKDAAESIASFKFEGDEAAVKN